MRMRFDVRVRRRRKKILVLEGLGEVQDVGELILGMLGLRADREGGR